MIVKFIVTKNGDIHFGDRYFKHQNHNEIAFRYHIDGKMVCGGGLADHDAKKIFGTSRLYGPYDPEKVKELLPDWKVEEPSSYFHLSG